MPPFENPTEAELKDTLEDADLPIGEDIEARLGKSPAETSDEDE